jgi:hypothetical protein
MVPKMHEQVCKLVKDGISTIDLQNVSGINSSIGIAQVFEKDGVHLTPTAGKVFIDTILYNSEEFFDAQFVDLEPEMEVVEEYIPTAPNTNATIESTEASKRLAAIEQELARLNEDLATRRLQDSMVTARLREEMDHTANTKKEDHIIITGLTSKTPMPHQAKDRQDWLRNIVGSIINEIVTDSSKNIVLIRQGRKNGTEIPLVEVKMDSREIAQKIRKEFAAKKRQAKNLAKSIYPIVLH